MTHEQLLREFRYRVAMSLARELLKSGMISEGEYQIADAKMIEYFQPVLAGLYP